MTKHADHKQFLLKLAANGIHYAQKDAPPTLAEIAEAQTKFAESFEVFKTKNDTRLEELDKKGVVDAVTQDEFKKVGDDMAELKEKLQELVKKAARPGGQGEKDGGGQLITPDQKEHQDAFVHFLRNPDSGEAKRALQEIEKKQVNTLTDAAGGAAVPEVIARRIERELSEQSDLTKIVDNVAVGSKDHKQLIDVRGAAYGWAGEGDTRAETGTSTLEEVAPTFGMIYAYPTATEESLDDMFFDVTSWIVNSVVEAFGEGLEAAIVSGNGTKKPTGFLNGATAATADGVRAFGTLQYVPSGAAAVINDADPLIGLVQEMKKGYRRNARWLMSKRTVGTIMTLKDGDGNYLWKMGDVKSGQPDRLLGYSITESEEMPDIAADATPIAFGDFKAGYMFNPLVGLRMTRDEITQVGFVKWYIRKRVGGILKKSEAIKLLKVANS